MTTTRKMKGRPTEMLYLRIDPSLKRELETWSSQCKMSVNLWVESLLKAALQTRGPKK